MNENRAQLKAAWIEFTLTGRVSNGAIRDDILQSWRRCRQRGLDPYSQAIRHTITPEEQKNILAANRLFVETARPLLESLFSLIKTMDMVIFLTDREGFILDALGEGDIWESCAAGNAVVGSSFNERFAGTTAPAIALALDAPFQMVCEEHYMLAVHSASCAAAPIHDDGRLIGSLDITMSSETALKHPHTLGMIVASAQVIEKQLRLTKELNKTFIAGQYLSATTEAVTTGLIILDGDRRITHVNQSAGDILGRKDDITPGMEVGELMQDHALLESLSRNTPLADYEISLPESPRKGQCLVSLIPVGDSGDNRMGSILILKELKGNNQSQKALRPATDLTAPCTFTDIRGASPGMTKTIGLARRVADTDVNVIVSGESGTGKEMIAQSIHNVGRSADGPFLPVNCAAIPDELIESELFGYEAGTFTGALKTGKPGRFELARDGTLFLDEVNGMSLDMQAKLLRVLEEKRVQRLGGKRYLPLQARIIAATNRNLEEEVELGRFRSDLYYRLNVVEIFIPPLRERPEDIPLLVEGFISEMNRRMGKSIEDITQEALEYLKSQPWPGNVRQLRNRVERAVTLAEYPRLTIDDFLHSREHAFAAPSLPQSAKEPPSRNDNGSGRLVEAERECIITALEGNHGNISRTAEQLGISRSTLYRKMNKYALLCKKVAVSVSR